MQNKQQPSFEEDATVCYCFRLTTGQLKSVYNQVGSLEQLQKCTKAGSACGGCGVILQTLFGERPQDINSLDKAPEIGSSCVKPGQRTMRGFIVASDGLESTVCSSNAVPPQLGSCDAGTEVEYTLVDHRGKLVLAGHQMLNTNEIFRFSTREHQLSRPFFGMFSLTYGRSNFGASRFNVYWSNENSTCATHENNGTGRPRVFLPFAFDARFLRGANQIYLAVNNPYGQPVPFQLCAFDLDDGPAATTWNAVLNPLNSTWVDINRDILQPVFEKFQRTKIGLKLEVADVNAHLALSVYFFLYCKKTNTWAANHL
jgi:bacterioferritin-associated ferredoxin